MGDRVRFSDEKLNEFLNDFKAHRARCEERFKECDNLVRILTQTQENNAKAIAELTDETRALVQLSKDFQGAARLGTSLQNLILWLAKWGFIGTGAAAILMWGSDKIGDLFK